jgi:hypothetical protein
MSRYVDDVVAKQRQLSFLFDAATLSRFSSPSSFESACLSPVPLYQVWHSRGRRSVEFFLFGEDFSLHTRREHDLTW